MTTKNLFFAALLLVSVAFYVNSASAAQPRPRPGPVIVPTNPDPEPIVSAN